MPKQKWCEDVLVKKTLFKFRKLYCCALSEKADPPYFFILVIYEMQQSMSSKKNDIEK